MEWMHEKCLEEYKLTNMVLSDTQNEWVNDLSCILGKGLAYSTILYITYYTMMSPWNITDEHKVYTIPYQH